MFKVKVYIIFFGTVGFSLHREGRYSENELWVGVRLPQTNPALRETTPDESGSAHLKTPSH
jgi:hypothetical protein